MFTKSTGEYILALLLYVATGCSSAGLSGNTSGDPKNAVKQPTADSTSVQAAPVQPAAPIPAPADPAAAPADQAGTGQASAVAADAPEGQPGTLINVSKTGFLCPKDMNLAVGDWVGTYKGSAAEFVAVAGTVDFTMAKIDATSLQVDQFGIAGGLFGGDQVKSIAIDFQMKCGDLALHDAVVNVAGKNIAVKLAFSGQSWNPPTFTGTWRAHIDLLNIDVASGTWQVQKK